MNIIRVQINALNMNAQKSLRRIVDFIWENMIFFISVFSVFVLFYLAQSLFDTAHGLYSLIEPTSTETEIQMIFNMSAQIQTWGFALDGLAFTILFAGAAINFSQRSSKDTNRILLRIDQNLQYIVDCISSNEEEEDEEAKVEDSTSSEGVAEESTGS